ncbi:MAG: hypothetical protein JRG89_00850 [Deltaproteobacteria bacterium]|nr:hypothetical protein [Deltaproteobacteria bacterium]MBW2386957.1 hypothetical protein [Deltaproteobacteria bacterium]MBW2722998.1 hypothetical protein [Deltaproteobacteria bacterium]
MRERVRPLSAATGLLCLVLTANLVSDPARAENCSAPGCTIAEINAWSSEVVELIRGPINIDVPEAGNVTFGDPADIPGVASGVPTEAVSLGDGGSVTVKFALPIYDGPDFDFAVFENAISSGVPGLLYMELGFVEVSSDGIQFARFDSLTSRITAVAGLEEADPDDYDNLAGNRVAGTGTEFDLFELANHPLVLSGDVDLDAIEYIRIEDVIGDDSTSDSMGSPIYDPFPTSFTSGGFDIDAVGAINVPEPGTEAGLVCTALGLLWLERRRSRTAR